MDYLTGRHTHTASVCLSGFSMVILADLIVMDYRKNLLGNCVADLLTLGSVNIVNYENCLLLIK